MNKFEDIIKYIKSILESQEKLEELRKKRMINYEPIKDDKISDAMIILKDNSISVFIEYKDNIKAQNQKVAMEIRTNKTSDAAFGKVLLLATDNMFYLEKSNGGQKVDYGKESVQDMINEIIKECKAFRTKSIEQDGSFVFAQSRDVSHDEIIIRENLKIAIEKIAQYEQEERQARILEENKGYEPQIVRIQKARKNIAEKLELSEFNIDHKSALDIAKAKGELLGKKGQQIK